MFSTAYRSLLELVTALPKPAMLVGVYAKRD